MLPSMRWHFLQTAPADGAWNMAMDESLMRRAARSGDAVFRIYGWSAPTLSLGRNQRARGCYDASVAAELGVAFVRRPTGGRALLHHREVTYSATLAAAGAGAASAAYDFINEVLLLALGSLGVGARRATETLSIPPGTRPCFDVPARHEIVVGERKLVGSAQWRHAGALLQHGSILVHDDQPLINRLLKPGTSGPPPVAATLFDALGWEPPVERVAEEIRVALAYRARGRVEHLHDDTVTAQAAELQAGYADHNWTWRR